MALDEDVVRIVISTDNHLGFKERDPVRGMDSFAAFEEVLSFSKSRDVDMVLLGGDIFHDNKPSRRTLHQTFDLLREYSLSDAPVKFQVISDQKGCFEGRRGMVNYEDPYYSVGLPIFAIHGNHDDPTREGGDDALAALDLLSVTNFINYFGKAEKVDDVTIKPILFRKGNTNVALYGLGNIRDERLNRMWEQQKVKFLRPTEEEGRDSFFNILVLHQNRAVGRGRRNAIYESMIPEWFDVVVWGHEHECQTEFEESVHGRFRVIQPGSTVATSLVDGESQPKHLMVLDIKGGDFRLTNHRLHNVRSFITEEIRLDDEEYGLDPEDCKVEKEIDNLLEDYVKTLVERVRRERAVSLLQDKEMRAPDNKLCVMQKPKQVLVRLKVDRLGFQTINNQRFGARFVGEVANPSDILMFHQRRRTIQDQGEGGAGGRKKSNSNALAMPIAPDMGDELNVEDLIADQLQNSDKKLRVLKEPELQIALEEYVQKQQANAISELVESKLEDLQSFLNKPEFREATTTALIQEAIEECAMPSQTTQGTAAPARRNRDELSPPPSPSQTQTQTQQNRRSPARSSRSSVSDRGATKKKATSNQRAAKNRDNISDSDDNFNDEEEDDQFDLSEEDEDEEDFGGGGKMTDLADSDDDLDDFPPPKKRAAPTKPAPRQTKKAATKTTKKTSASSSGSTTFEKRNQATSSQATTNFTQASSQASSSSRRRALPGWATSQQSQSVASEYPSPSKSVNTTDDWA